LGSSELFINAPHHCLTQDSRVNTARYLIFPAFRRSSAIVRPSGVLGNSWTQGLILWRAAKVRASRWFLRDASVLPMILCPGRRNGMYLQLSALTSKNNAMAYGITSGSPCMIRGTIVARRARTSMNLPKSGKAPPQRSNTCTPSLTSSLPLSDDGIT